MSVDIDYAQHRMKVYWVPHSKSFPLFRRPPPSRPDIAAEYKFFAYSLAHSWEEVDAMKERGAGRGFLEELAEEAKATRQVRRAREMRGSEEECK